MTVILVAEDDPAVCGFLTDALDFDLAATVRCEPTGILVLRAIETAAFDLALIDVDMPELPGYELARRAANRGIPALLSCRMASMSWHATQFDKKCLRLLQNPWSRSLH
jgi:CheY-like chemotaxis protein